MKKSKRRLYVVGHNKLLSQLMRSALQPAFDVQCTCLEALDECEVKDSDDVRNSAPAPMFLVDDGDETARLKLYGMLARKQPETKQVAVLFNVDPARSDACEAVRRGVKGVFLLSDPMDQVLEGVKTLLEGGTWIPQELLLQAATDRRLDTDIAVLESGLTLREIEILSIASTGATNDEIAAKLFISPHTVKTHMYNLFHKIGVQSRTRAVLWGIVHLRDRFPGFATASEPSCDPEPDSRAADGAPRVAAT